MATTVEQCARGVISRLSTSANYLLAAQWVNARWKYIAGRRRLKQLRNVFGLTVPANVTAGTVTTTWGSPTVTGDATAAAAWGPSIVGRFIRPTASNTWYEIIRVAGNVLTLAVPFSETAIASGAYVIATRYSALDATVRWIGDPMVNMRRRRPVRMIGLEQLDALAPSRDLYSAGGTGWGIGWGGVFAEVGLTDDNAQQRFARRVEVYPYSSDTELYYYTGYIVPPDFDLRDVLPPTLDEHVLVEGALIDLMRYNMASAAEAGKADIAAFWRNESRAQETKWEAVMKDAFRADDGVDDRTFILQRTNFNSDFEIRTARDDVLSRWPGW